ncbi:metalloendoproteinase 2-MMP-like [Quillaja saponaria]|uniref:Metalloendoproteinase 2-MMP-like n=1 Tax=Quillaja saponaria TaxID=32244 RepID=A0AAD7Q421_QUISA|nr:metalloendoproteinase 2-MMP-like [Quillaja saponaria]
MFRFNLPHLFAANFLLFLVILQCSVVVLVQSRSLKPKYQQSTNFLENLEGIQKGQTNKGLIQLKQYLNKFGYLNTGDDSSASNTNLTDEFDENLELAIKHYQQFNNLDVSGKLDANTIKQMLIPRCGVPDMINQSPSNSDNFTMIVASHFTFFPNMQKWQPSNTRLTYSFGPVSQNVGIDQVRSACASAFQKWAAVSQFTFEEGSEGQQTNIVIGFYSGDHGDGRPFDGPGRILAHAFAPENGNFHYDADENWSNNPVQGQFDLESLALHEIGHLLGLGHSQDPNAIMVSGIESGAIRRNLGQDDINGIRALYST